MLDSLDLATFATALLASISSPYPRSCCFCRRPEANEFLMGNNHWVRPRRHDDTSFDWPTAHGLCIAMDLTRNHVTYHQGRLGYPSPHRAHMPDPVTRKGRASETEQLRRSIDHARQLWAHRPDIDWLTAAQNILDRVDPKPPTPTGVRAAEHEEALF